MTIRNSCNTCFDCSKGYVQHLQPVLRPLEDRHAAPAKGTSTTRKGMRSTCKGYFDCPKGYPQHLR
ncbi:MAG: hypothetical protein EOO12_01080 [Chitinophagaceae bacterium]|nr:MAG: hypothetical protein EOO12_01080 [Chitinophagaceae bacterium]